MTQRDYNNTSISNLCTNCGETWTVLIKDAKQVSKKDGKLIIYDQCPTCKHTAEVIQEIKND